jgi:hypothetical protein
MTKVRIILVGIIAAFVLGAFLASCDKKDDGQETGTSSTETTVEFDHSSFGIYKGVIVGSSGTLKIEINNGNSSAKAWLTIDGQSDVLTCSATFTEGQAIRNAAFTGAFSSFTFSVDADGGNPVIENLSIEGHSNVVVVVIKETSNSVVAAYEGTYTGGNNAAGVLNIARNNNRFAGSVKGDDGFTAGLSGTIDGNGNFSGTSHTTFNGLSVTLTYSGKFTGDNVSGTWNNSWQVEEETRTNSGSFSGSKTL